MMQPFGRRDVVLAGPSFCQMRKALHKSWHIHPSLQLCVLANKGTRHFDYVREELRLVAIEFLFENFYAGELQEVLVGTRGGSQGDILF